MVNENPIHRETDVSGGRLMTPHLKQVSMLRNVTQGLGLKYKVNIFKPENKNISYVVTALLLWHLIPGD